MAFKNASKSLDRRVNPYFAAASVRVCRLHFSVFSGRTRCAQRRGNISRSARMR